MGRKAKPVEIKTCEKCGEEHTRPKSKYCSNECGLTARWTDKRKREHSVTMKKYKQTDRGEDNTYNIRKDRQVPLPVVHPDDPGLEGNAFSDGEVLWYPDESDDNDSFS